MKYLIVLLILLVILLVRFVCAYAGAKEERRRSDMERAIVAAAPRAIAAAEEAYELMEKAGYQKMLFAVDQILEGIPDALQIFDRNAIAHIIQAAFDQIDKYAVILVNKAAEKAAAEPEAEEE